MASWLTRSSPHPAPCPGAVSATITSPGLWSWYPGTKRAPRRTPAEGDPSYGGRRRVRTGDFGDRATWPMPELRPAESLSPDCRGAGRPGRPVVVQSIRLLRPMPPQSTRGSRGLQPSLHPWAPARWARTAGAHIRIQLHELASHYLRAEARPAAVVVRPLEFPPLYDFAGRGNLFLFFLMTDTVINKIVTFSLAYKHFLIQTLSKDPVHSRCTGASSSRSELWPKPLEHDPVRIRRDPASR